MSNNLEKDKNLKNEDFTFFKDKVKSKNNFLFLIPLVLFLSSLSSEFIKITKYNDFISIYNTNKSTNEMLIVDKLSLSGLWANKNYTYFESNVKDILNYGDIASISNVLDLMILLSLNEKNINNEFKSIVKNILSQNMYKYKNKNIIKKFNELKNDSILIYFSGEYDLIKEEQIYIEKEILEIERKKEILLDKLSK